MKEKYYGLVDHPELEGGVVGEEESFLVLSLSALTFFMRSSNSFSSIHNCLSSFLSVSSEILASAGKFLFNNLSISSFEVPEVMLKSDHSSVNLSVHAILTLNVLLFVEELQVQNLA
jgi:hypothetical protein